MYDLNLDVIGGGPRASTQLSFSQAIFVIEDVDACSHIVRRRVADAALNRTENASMEEGSWSPSSSSTSPVTAASTTLPGEAPPSCRVSPTAATSPLDHGPLPLRFGPPVMLPPPPLPTHPLPPHQLPPHPPGPHPRRSIQRSFVRDASIAASSWGSCSRQKRRAWWSTTLASP